MSSRPMGGAVWSILNETPNLNEPQLPPTPLLKMLEEPRPPRLISSSLDQPPPFKGCLPTIRFALPSCDLVARRRDDMATGPWPIRRLDIQGDPAALGRSLVVGRGRTVPLSLMGGLAMYGELVALLDNDATVWIAPAAQAGRGRSRPRAEKKTVAAVTLC